MTRPQINWKVVIDDMRLMGVSGYQIAKRLEVSWSTVQSWRDCKEDVSYGAGKMLLRLHAQVCGSALTFRRMAEGEQKPNVMASFAA